MFFFCEVIIKLIEKHYIMIQIVVMVLIKGLSIDIAWIGFSWILIIIKQGRQSEFNHSPDKLTSFIEELTQFLIIFFDEASSF